jgi:hypothetical protein
VLIEPDNRSLALKPASLTLLCTALTAGPRVQHATEAAASTLCKLQGRRILPEGCASSFFVCVLRDRNL